MVDFSRQVYYKGDRYMFGWFTRKNKEPTRSSLIEETDSAWDECRELQKRYGWSEEKLDEELAKRIETNAHAYVNGLRGKAI